MSKVNAGVSSFFPNVLNLKPSNAATMVGQQAPGPLMVLLSTPVTQS